MTDHVESCLAFFAEEPGFSFPLDVSSGPAGEFLGECYGITSTSNRGDFAEIHISVALIGIQGLGNNEEGWLLCHIIRSLEFPDNAQILTRTDKGFCDGLRRGPRPPIEIEDQVCLR